MQYLRAFLEKNGESGKAADLHATVGLLPLTGTQSTR
jgi:hypothetical protein